MYWWVYPFVLPLTAATVALVVFARMRAGQVWPSGAKAALAIGVIVPYLLIVVAALVPGQLFTRPITAVVLALLVVIGLVWAALIGWRQRAPRPLGRHAG